MVTGTGPSPRAPGVRFHSFRATDRPVAPDGRHRGETEGERRDPRASTERPRGMTIL